MFEAIRKFGLGHCDFPTMLSNITFFLRTLSLNVDPRNQTRIPKIYTIVGVAFSASYCYVYMVSMIWFVFWRCMETGDVLSALIIFSLGTASQIGPYKILFMFYYRIRLTRLVGQCLDSYTLAEPGSRFLSNLIKSLRIVKRRAIVFWCVTMMNGFLYLIKPIILPGRHLMEDLFILFGLEPIFETPNYQIAFTLMGMGVCVSVYFPSNATSFQILMSGYVEAQMLALSEELGNLWNDAENYYSEFKSIQANITNNNIEDSLKEKDVVVNEYINRGLQNIIKAHSTNLSLLNEMENVFRGAIAVEFSLLMVGLIAELLAGLQNTYLEVPFALVQVCMDCFIGQNVADASMAFEIAVYHCNWERFNKHNMKLVILMLLTSQRTMALSAGSITKLNFVSLLVIIKMIYSAYTTLRASMNY